MKYFKSVMLFLLFAIVATVLWFARTRSHPGVGGSTNGADGGSNVTPDVTAVVRMPTVGGMNGLVKFHGLVVDHLGSPLAGVKVEYSITRATTAILTPVTAFNDDSFVTHTGPDGRFAITNTGRSLRIEKLTAAGYDDGGRRVGFAYGDKAHAEEHNYATNYSTPYRFTLVNLSRAEPLIMKKRHTTRLAPGESKNYNILTAKFGGAEYPDLMLTASRDLRTLQITVPEGGITIGPSGNSMLAPEGGYTNELRIPLADAGADLNLFVKTRARRLIAHLDTFVSIAPPGEAHVVFETRINPKGSPNLAPGGGQLHYSLVEEIDRTTRQQTIGVPGN